MARAKSKAKSERIVLAAQNAWIEGVGEVLLYLDATSEDGWTADEFTVGYANTQQRVNGKPVRHCMRRFLSILKALRSYRRFVNLSDEVRLGYGA